MKILGVLFLWPPLLKGDLPSWAGWSWEPEDFYLSYAQKIPSPQSGVSPFVKGNKFLTQFLHLQSGFHESAIWEDTWKKMHSFGIQTINGDIFSFFSIWNCFLDYFLWRDSWLVNCRSFFESDIPHLHEVSFHPDWADGRDGDSAFFEFLI